MTTSYCGYIALIGRPNVGKSTLLNCIIREKVSITSRKPQTTRHRVMGIETRGNNQLVYVDTPGIHRKTVKAMNRLMNKAAISTLRDVDVIVWLIDGMQWKPDDDYILSMVQTASVPCVLVINKVDKITDKDLLLPWIQTLQQRHTFAAIVPLSAKDGTQVEALQTLLMSMVPEGPHLFPDDYYTDRSVRFQCAELLREKIFRFYGQELPYSMTVEIESFQETEELVKIHALITVDKASHKRMLIGEKGAKLKEVATLARHNMEKLLDKKVFLQCWCKVKTGWSDDERFLKHLGYE